VKGCVFGALMLLEGIVFAEKVQIDFDVRDYEGNPIEGVDILCATREVTYVPYAESKRVKVHFTTDRDGKVCGRFKCWEGFVDCYFRAEGYYPEDVRDVIFSAPYEKSVGRYVFKETEKKLNVKMRKIKNPVEMVYHRIMKGDKELPSRCGRFAYDIEKGDWVKPNGQGEITDFIVVYDWRKDENSLTCTGGIIFVEEGAGAYAAKKYPCKKFPVDYSLNPNAAFKQFFPFAIYSNDVTKEDVRQRVMKDDEYLVIRSRVKLDAKGNVLEANYSQIQGPIGIGYYFAIGSSYFNPKVNDTNLEYVQKW